MFSESFGFGLLVRPNLIRSPWALQKTDLVLRKKIKYLIKYFTVLEKGQQHIRLTAGRQPIPSLSVSVFDPSCCGVSCPCQRLFKTIEPLQSGAWQVDETDHFDWLLMWNSGQDRKQKRKKQAIKPVSVARFPHWMTHTGQRHLLVWRVTVSHTHSVGDTTVRLHHH